MCAAVTGVVATVTFFGVATFFVTGFVTVFFVAAFTVVAGSTVAHEPPGRTTAPFAQVGAAAGTEEDTVGCATTLATLTVGGSVAVGTTGSDVGVAPWAAAWLTPAANALITSMEPMLAAAVMRVARWNSCCDRSMAPW